MASWMCTKQNWRGRKKNGDKVTKEHGADCRLQKEVQAEIVVDFTPERKNAFERQDFCTCTMAESSSSGGGKVSLLPKDLASFFGPFCTLCKCVFKTSYTVHLGEYKSF